jgi:hypothetical protein
MSEEPARVFLKRHADERGRADLISVIDGTGPNGCTLTVIRLRPEAVPPQKARTYGGADDAKAAEPAFLKEVADHECSATCGQWVVG